MTTNEIRWRVGAPIREQGLTHLHSLSTVIGQYANARNHTGESTTTRLSPYIRRRLVLEDEVLEYLEANYDAVQADMDACSTTVQPKEGDRRKRHELSRSATKAICLSAFTLSVKFD